MRTFIAMAVLFGFASAGVRADDPKSDERQLKVEFDQEKNAKEVDGVKKDIVLIRKGELRGGMTFYHDGTAVVWTVCEFTHPSGVSDLVVKVIVMNAHTGRSAVGSAVPKATADIRSIVNKVEDQYREKFGDEEKKKKKKKD